MLVLKIVLQSSGGMKRDIKSTLIEIEIKIRGLPFITGGGGLEDFSLQFFGRGSFVA